MGAQRASAPLLFRGTSTLANEFSRFAMNANSPITLTLQRTAFIEVADAFTARYSSANHWHLPTTENSFMPGGWPTAARHRACGLGVTFSIGIEYTGRIGGWGMVNPPILIRRASSYLRR